MATEPTAVVAAGVDGSPSSRAALRWAADEATHRDCELHVVHAWVLPTPAAAGARPPVSVPDAAQHLADAQATVEQIAREELGSTADAICLATRGAPVRVLIAAGKTARLIVVGRRGAGGFAGLRIGSVSEQLVHHAPCPVLVVPVPPAPRSGRTAAGIATAVRRRGAR